MPEPRSGPTMRERALAQRLADLRSRLGITQQRAAAELGVSEDTIRRLERSGTRLQLKHVRALLDLYRLPPAEAAEFLAQVRQARTPGWWHEWRDVLPRWLTTQIAAEDTATLIRSWSGHTVPALLRTRRYAAALLRQRPRLTAPELARMLELLQRRQQILDRARPPHLWAVLDHSVLTRPVGGTAVMAEQRAHLRALAARPAVTIQIVPRTAGPHPAGGAGDCVLLRFEAPDSPDLVLRDGLTAPSVTEDLTETRACLAALDQAASMAARPGGVAHGTDQNRSDGDTCA